MAGTMLVSLPLLLMITRAQIAALGLVPDDQCCRVICVTWRGP